MTNEEAIAVLEEQSNFYRAFQHYFESKSTEISTEKLNAPKLVADRYRKLANAFDAGISAMQSVGKDITVPTKDDHFRDLAKIVPITLEELIDLGVRAERGEKIIVYCTPLNDWCKVFKYGIMFFGTGDYRSWREIEETYGKDWEAYAYPPAHIDREAWTAEWLSEDIGEDMRCQCSKCGYPVSYFWGRTEFCPGCGKAMKPEAWAELEKRLRG